MALNAYRAYGVGLRCSGRSVVSPVAVSPSQTLEGTRRIVARRYATESALSSKKKGAPSAKSTHKAVGVSSAAPKRTPAKVEERATGHVGQTPAAAQVKTLPKRPSATKTALKAAAPKTPKTPKTAAPLAAPQPERIEKVEAELTPEEQQLQELEALQYFGKVLRTSDPYGQPIPYSLDVNLPRPTGITSVKKYGSLGQWWSQMWTNRLNDAKNAASFFSLASDEAIPGYRLGHMPWYKAFTFLAMALKTRSTKNKAWSAGLRKQALEAYVDLNRAVSSRDTKHIKNITTSEYQSEILRRIKKQPAGYTFRWKLEREISPVRIESLRVTQYYLAKEEPKFGSRYLVHALVKFDTEQSLECYAPNGAAVHEVAEGAVKQSNGTIAAKPKRVTEYLILEKRLWYDAPWVFREQRWETSARQI
ncbi:hypothetical protein FA15DRAFT_674297 [Coprinopsis marcescibilis]|uniref:Tim44-like domain-containing protein n=1 Tax=Coprinopsis marcescibilis TaxID=230819 RepID=A0A5C3KI32_COPMA|nr:hypothetical protein FA15DRAFT_674297 [Coprinopsis marcescibilis]